MSEMSVINRTGKMYVVWTRNPEVSSRQDGIEKVIESIGLTRAEYAWCKMVVSEIVRNSVLEEADYRADMVPEFDTKMHYRGTQTIDDERDKTRDKVLEEFGIRAVYEVRVKHVGNVDKDGNWIEVK